MTLLQALAPALAPSWGFLLATAKRVLAAAYLPFLFTGFGLVGSDGLVVDVFLDVLVPPPPPPELVV